MEEWRTAKAGHSPTTSRRLLVAVVNRVCNFPTISSCVPARKDMSGAVMSTTYTNTHTQGREKGPGTWRECACAWRCNVYYYMQSPITPRTTHPNNAARPPASRFRAYLNNDLLLSSVLPQDYTYRPGRLGTLRNGEPTEPSPPGLCCRRCCCC